MRIFRLFACFAAMFAAPAVAQVSVPGFQRPVPGFQRPVPGFQRPVPGFQAPSPAFGRPVLQPAGPGLQALQQRLTLTASEATGEYGIAAMDLLSGQTVSYNGNVAFPMASTVKVAVAATYLAQVDAGRRTLDDRFGGLTADQLMEAMLTRSDNHATDQLLAMLGGPQVVDAWLRAHGLAGIRVDRTIAQLLAARRDLRDIRDSATPLAMLRLLQMLDTSDVLSPRSRAILLDKMSRCRTGSNRIRYLLPPGTRVEHKTGTLTGYTGDMAFVTLPSGRRIAMVIFARFGDNRPAVIASAARQIYDAFVEETDRSTTSTMASYPWQRGATGAPGNR